MNSEKPKEKDSRAKYRRRMFKEYVVPLLFILFGTIFIVYAKSVFKMLIHKIPIPNTHIKPSPSQTEPVNVKVNVNAQSDLPVPSRINSLNDDLNDVRFDYYQSSMKLPTPTPFLDNYSIKSNLTCFNSTQFIDSIYARTPMGFNDTSATSCNALNWDLWDMAERIPILLGVIRRLELNTIFTPLDVHSPMTASDNGEVTNSIDSSTMFGWSDVSDMQIVVYSEFALVNYLLLSTDLNSGYMHFSTNYRALEELFDLEGDTDWKQFRIHEFIFQDSNFSSNSSKSMIWLNYPGTVMQTRYDEDHSFRVQLAGTSRIHLFPPESYNYLNYYPITHVYNRQSQIDFSNNSQYNESKLVSFEYVLHPGHVLYIPPFWSVRHESINFTVSLNIRSASEENARLLEAYMMWLPYAEFAKTKVERVVVSQIFLVHLISRSTSSSPKKFSRDLLKVKWNSIYPNTSNLWQYFEHFNCYEDETDLVKNIVKRMPELKTKKAANFISDAINHESISKAVRNIWLGNYIEEAARWAMLGFQPSVDASVELSDAMKDKLEGIKSAVFIKKCLNYERVEIVDDVEGPSILRI